MSSEIQQSENFQFFELILYKSSYNNFTIKSIFNFLINSEKIQRN